jgi:hypothetical protein
LDREHGDRYSDLMLQFNRQVNAAYVDPRYIAKVRKKLDLDQRRAAELFGGGANAFNSGANAGDNECRITSLIQPCRGAFFASAPQIGRERFGCAPTVIAWSGSSVASPGS